MPARSLARTIVIVLLVMAAGSLVAGVTGYLLAREGIVVLTGPIASRVPEERHVAFITDLWAHSASYIFGFAGGLVLIWRVRKARRLAGGRAAILAGA
jgi:membrane associated rhomboid family serine protease